MRTTLDKWCNTECSPRKALPVQICISLLALLKSRIECNGFSWDNKYILSYCPPPPPVMNFTDCHGLWCWTWVFGCVPNLIHKLKSTYHPCSKRITNNFLKVLWILFLLTPKSFCTLTQPVECLPCTEFTLTLFTVTCVALFLIPNISLLLFWVPWILECLGRIRAVWEARGTRHSR